MAVSLVETYEAADPDEALDREGKLSLDRLRRRPGTREADRVMDNLLPAALEELLFSFGHHVSGTRRSRAASFMSRSARLRSLGRVESSSFASRPIFSAS